MYPTDRRYTKDHEWIRMEGGIAVIGITDFAQRELGDIVFVELPQAGRSVQPGDVLGTIESVKAVSEIFVPVAGTVLEGNALLQQSPEAVNRDPHGEAWYCKLRPADARDVDALLDAGSYAELTGA
jgi:glycine cleavage system H protein